MVKIVQQLVPAALASKVTGRGTNKKKWITVHQTGNTGVGAGAQAHANLQSKGNNRAASWHLQVDDVLAIQSFSYDTVCWAAGDGGVGNTDSLHVEMAVNSDGDYLLALKNTAELVKYLMDKFKIPLSNVVQHNKWSGKNCPSHIRRSYKGRNWGDFKNMVQGAYLGKPTTPVNPVVPSVNLTASVVDYMNSKGINSSFANRKKLATQHGIEKYSGTASQNLALLNKLKGGAQANPNPVTKPATTSKPTPTVYYSKKKDGKKYSAGVLKLQKDLISIHFYPEKNKANRGADGYYGNATEDAVIRFQSVYTPKEVDGIAGPKTLAALARKVK